MPGYAGIDPTNHLGTDSRVMDVGANIDAEEDGDNVEGESVAHCVCIVQSIPVMKPAQIRTVDTNE